MSSELARLVALNKSYDFATEIHRMPMYDDEPEMFFYSLRVNTRFNKLVDWASAIRFVEEDALTIAFYEAIERYFISLYDFSELRLLACRELDGQKISLGGVVNNTDVRKIKDIEDRPLYWTWAEEFSTGERVHIPAQMVFLPFDPPGEFKIREHISTGAACGKSRLDAIIRGVLECIERDSFMVAFLTRRQQKRIQGYHSTLVSLLTAHGIETHLIKLNGDCEVHSVLCILEDRSGRKPPAIAAGCACDFDIGSAIEKALLECLKIRLWIKTEILRNRRRFLEAKRISVARRSIVDRGLYWGHPKNKKELKFFLESPLSINYEGIERDAVALAEADRMRILSEWLGRHGFSLLIRDFSNDDLRSNDLHVVRAIVPELHPLYVNEKFRYDCGARLGVGEINRSPLPLL